MKPVRGTYVASMSRAWARHHWWAIKVHDMPNADYQRGLKWFKEWKDYGKRVGHGGVKGVFYRNGRIEERTEGSLQHGKVAPHSAPR